MRVCADTNIIVSGLNFPGNPRRLLMAAESGAVRLCVSPAILEEVKDVLQRKKFGWTPDEASQAVDWISQIADVVTPSQPVSLVERDPDDDRILECALAARSDYVVSGDKDLLDLNVFQGKPIAKVADFLEKLQQRFR